MKRIYHPYHKWEDYQNGLYDTLTHYTEKQWEDMAQSAYGILTDAKQFYSIAKTVINKWPCASEVNLSNKSRNRQAWLGQAACCMAHGIPEQATKYGWRLMTPEQQSKANAVADKVIAIWESRYAKKIQ